MNPREVENAPDAANVARQFHERFGYNVLLSSWNEILDRRFLQIIYQEANIPFLDVGYFHDQPHKYHDYHFFDLWVVAYTYLLERGYNGNYRGSEIYKQFGFEKRSLGHNALADCRLEAEILRKIVLSPSQI